MKTKRRPFFWCPSGWAVRYSNGSPMPHHLASNLFSFMITKQLGIQIPTVFAGISCICIQCVKFFLIKIFYLKYEIFYRSADAFPSTSRDQTSPIPSSHRRTSRLPWHREESPVRSRYIRSSEAIASPSPHSYIGRNRGTKRHVSDERRDDSSDRRASSTSHSKEKKKKHEDHQR